MSYRWSYLWASAAVDLTGWNARRPNSLGPTTLTYLADEAAAHLRRAERYTLCLYKSSGAFGAKRAEAFKVLVQSVIEDLTVAVRLRHPGLHFTDQTTLCHNACAALRLRPADEWHPVLHKGDSSPLIVQCDASWRSPQQVRAGITWKKGTKASIDLASTSPASNTHAEFLGLCLATLTQVGDRTPLKVRCDNDQAVHALNLLGKGIMPHWMYADGNDVAQRIAIAAMTSMRLRPVTIQWVRRTRVSTADQAATYKGPTTDVMTPTTWAKRQGMPLSWYDTQRGLEHP